MDWDSKIEIPHRLYDCKVIGLRWPKANLLYDEEEASADAAWDKSLGSRSWTLIVA
jgi:hypothetical protein